MTTSPFSFTATQFPIIVESNFIVQKKYHDIIKKQLEYLFNKKFHSLIEATEYCHCIPGVDINGNICRLKLKSEKEIFTEITRREMAEILANAHSRPSVDYRDFYTFFDVLINYIEEGGHIILAFDCKILSRDKEFWGFSKHGGNIISRPIKRFFLDTQNKDDIKYLVTKLISHLIKSGENESNLKHNINNIIDHEMIDDVLTS